MRGWGSGDETSTLMQAINLSVRHTPALHCPIQSLGSTSAPPPSSQGQDGSEGLGLHWPPLYPARGHRGDRKLGVEEEGGEWRSKRKDRTGSNCRRCRMECKSADMFSVGSTAGSPVSLFLVSCVGPGTSSYYFSQECMMTVIFIAGRDGGGRSE